MIVVIAMVPVGVVIAVRAIVRVIVVIPVIVDDRCLNRGCGQGRRAEGYRTRDEGGGHRGSANPVGHFLSSIAPCGTPGHVISMRPCSWTDTDLRPRDYTRVVTRVEACGATAARARQPRVRDDSWRT